MASDSIIQLTEADGDDSLGGQAMGDSGTLEESPA